MSISMLLLSMFIFSTMMKFKYKFNIIKGFCFSATVDCLTHYIKSTTNKIYNMLDSILDALF